MEKSNVGAESAKSSASVVESLTRTKEAIGSAASEAVDSAGSDLDALVRDLNGLKDTLAVPNGVGTRLSCRFFRLPDAGCQSRPLAKRRHPPYLLEEQC